MDRPPSEADDIRIPAGFRGLLQPKVIESSFKTISSAYPRQSVETILRIMPPNSLGQAQIEALGKIHEHFLGAASDPSTQAVHGGVLAVGVDVDVGAGAVSQQT